MTVLLLPTKLAMPRPSHGWVHRARLTDLLTDGFGARLVLVSAPPGFGKTTALVDWLGTSRVRCSWLALDAADNDPGRFLRYLWSAAWALAGSPAADPTGTGHTADAGDVVDEICRLLVERTSRAVLVLDDYHHISARPIRHAVGLLLDRLPQGVQLVISTRHDPALPLARLRAQGELVEIRAADLRFARDEARAFLTKRLGVQLGDDDLEMLMARTEGWPAVLQLAGLSLVGRSDVTRRVRAFAASHRYVLDYVTDEVLAGLDDTDRSFLVTTSVLDRLTGSLCDALTGRTDGQATLERLEQANVLLVPLDEQRRWYRYHHLFSDLLRARLAADHPDRGAALHLRASDWYAEHGFVAEAMEHALRSGDAERASASIAGMGGALIHAGELETLLGLMDRLPDAVVRGHFRLSTFYALALVLEGRTDGVEERLADAEAALPEAVAAGRPGAPVQASYHALIRSIAARLRQDPDGAVRHCQRALALAPPGAAPLLADIRGTLGLALLDAGDVDRAVDELRAARPGLRATGNWIALADATRDLARSEARRGHLRAALGACDEVLPDFVAEDGHEMPAAARIHLARAEILARTGDTSAETAADRAIELARQGGDVTSLREARAVRERVAAMPARSAAAPGSLVEPLTPRELEVLRLVAIGRSNRQIAAELFVTLATVKSHVHSASGKLGAANRVEAVAAARELLLLP